MKKKALIISTVVMVVVLIASLTTATYAWFSQQAKAQVDPVTIQTSAAKGFQIAVVDNSGSDPSYSNGTHTLDSTTWKNTAQGGWGDTVGFTTNSTGLLSLNGVTGTGAAATMIMPKVAVDTIVKTNTATGGDNNSTEFQAATANVNYFSAPIAIFNQDTTADSKNLQATISVKSLPNLSSKHGMAAALRIAFIYTIGSTNYLVYVNPYADAHYLGASQTWETGTAESKYIAIDTENGKSVGYYDDNLKAGTVTAVSSGNDQVAIVNGANTVNSDALKETIEVKVQLGAIAKNEVRSFTLVMWYEGEDAECIKTLAGGGAEISIEFKEKDVTP